MLLSVSPGNFILPFISCTCSWVNFKLNNISCVILPLNLFPPSVSDGEPFESNFVLSILEFTTCPSIHNCASADVSLKVDTPSNVQPLPAKAPVRDSPFNS